MHQSEHQLPPASGRVCLVRMLAYNCINKAVQNPENWRKRYSKVSKFLKMQAVISAIQGFGFLRVKLAWPRAVSFLLKKSPNSKIGSRFWVDNSVFGGA